MQPSPVAVSVVLDCADLEVSAEFWTQALGYRRAEGIGDRYLSLVPPTGPGVELLLQRVPERKSGKNRLHLDLRTPSLAEQVARVERAGAVRLTDEPLREGGFAWHVLADPDGNEFCVVQPPTDALG